MQRRRTLLVLIRPIVAIAVVPPVPCQAKPIRVNGPLDDHYSVIQGRWDISKIGVGRHKAGRSSSVPVLSPQLQAPTPMEVTSNPADKQVRVQIVSTRSALRN